MNCCPTSPGMNYTEESDLQLLNEALGKKEYETIVKSPSLFWTLFSTVFAQQSSQAVKKGSFHAQIFDDKIQIEGNNKKIISIKNIVEELRKVSLECLQKPSVNHLLISLIYNLYFRSPSQVINIEVNSTENKQLSETLFHSIIQPNIEKLFASVGIDYSAENCKQLINVSKAPKSIIDSVSHLLINKTEFVAQINALNITLKSHRVDAV